MLLVTCNVLHIMNSEGPSTLLPKCQCATV